MDQPEDEDFEREGISMEGLDSVHLWAQGELPTVLSGARGPAQAIESAHMLCPQTHLP